ncbi:MAG: class I SAM-dependent methyltransferase [Planctomycetes bacterium]|nr:class I SAM-dependent methyltransferase [Planctomycetota bacterium]
MREINDYVQSLVPERPEEVRRMEEQAGRDGFPIIGPACGQLCYLLTRLIGARRIFELGSGYGYSTYWFARAVRENGGGVVHHTVWNDDLSTRARGHLAALGLDDLVEFHVAEAIETLRTVGGEYDLLFCDIDKHAYAEALAEMDRHLRPGGLVIFDNVLLHGAVLPSRVAEETSSGSVQGRTSDADDRRRATRDGVLATTSALCDGDFWIASLVPLRDGLAVAMKVPS